ncbi:MAG: RNA polymerase sigma factor [Alistipes sp.]|nr:RNA polymerase sigma factor [Alistipes senegalensis]MCM1250839.1 RNA polymerase sigma factor [Alistipes sp.]
MKNHNPECRKELEELVDRYRQPLFRFAFFRLGSRMDAEDVVQDAFLKWASRSGHPVGNPQAYLFRMVSNGCCDRLRRRTSFVAFDRMPPLPDPSVQERDACEEARHIESLLDRLPPEQAEAIRLHTYASLRFTEIAEVLRCPVSTVKSRFGSGIEKLKKTLNP